VLADYVGNTGENIVSSFTGPPFWI